MFNACTAECVIETPIFIQVLVPSFICLHMDMQVKCVFTVICEQG